MVKNILLVAVCISLATIGGQGFAQNVYGGPPASGAHVPLGPAPYFAPGYVADGVAPVSFQAAPTANPEKTRNAAPEGCDLGCSPTVPQWTFFGDLIYLCPRNVEVSLAVPADGPVDLGRVPVQNGPTVIADFGYEPGFRVGGTIQFTECSQLRSTATWLEATTNAWGSTTPPLVMWPMVTHPEVDLADRTFLDASARYLLDLELLDLDWVRILAAGPYHRLDLVLGARYAGLSQELRSYFIANNADQVAVDVNYNGGGIRIGLEGEWFDTTRTLLVYARSAASFTAGEFRCGYRQDNNLGQRLVDTSWKAGRVVSILDLEVGLGWQNRCENLRLTAGYMFSGWHNAITVPEYIAAVQTNSYVGIGDFLTFDGFVGRVEFRY